jgi:HAD superfamily hydrolase (TIGR01509 family)
MKFKGIIFDFNGVLLYDAHLHVQAWQQSAQALRGSELSDEELSVHIHGRNNSHILHYLTGRSLERSELDELTQAKESLYRRLCLAQGALFTLSPGAEELLGLLAAKNIPRTIATSSERTNLDFFITHLKLDRWFDVQRIVYDDGSFPGKPAPDMYLRAAGNLGLRPQECVVIEDAISGLRSAHAAGIGCIVALRSRSHHGTLEACEGVTIVIETLEQLPMQLFTERA